MFDRLSHNSSLAVEDFVLVCIGIRLVSTTLYVSLGLISATVLVSSPEVEIPQATTLLTRVGGLLIPEGSHLVFRKLSGFWVV